VDNVVDGFDNPTGRARYLVLKDIPTSPRWDVTQITFTKTLEVGEKAVLLSIWELLWENFKYTTTGIVRNSDST
jgi:hypothetical protein